MSRKKGVLFSYLLLMVEMVSSILFTPFLISSLGQAEYGIFILISSITTSLMLLDLGVGNAVVRYMAKYRVLDDKRAQQNFLAMTTLFYLAISVLIIVLSMFIQNLLPTFFNRTLSIKELEIAEVMLGITVINAAVTLMISPYDKTIIAFENFVFSKILAIFKTVVRVSISILALKMGGDAITLVTINLIVTIIFGIFSFLFVSLKLTIIPKFNGIDISFIKEVGSYTIFIFIQMVATQINSVVDKVLLGSLVSTTMVGIYAIGSQISMYFQSIAGSINGILMPGVVKLVELNAEAKDFMEEMIRVGRILFMILGFIWITFVVFGQSFVNLWVGNENSEGYLVAVIIIFPMIFSMTQSVGSQILWAKGKHQVQAYLKIIVSILNIGLTLVLIKWNPLIGASLGTAISLLVGDVLVMNVVYSKIIKISIKNYYIRLFKGIVPSLFFVLITGLIVNVKMVNSWKGFLISCAIMTGSYILVMWFLGMNKYEKDVVKSFTRKLHFKA